MSTLVPTVIEKENGSERAYDLYSRLLKDRVIMLNSDVNEQVMGLICAQMLFLEAEAPGKPIHFYINSPGGSVIAGLQVYDTMRFISSPVYTYVLGQAASMGSFLAAAGDKRFVSPFSRTMIHMVSAGQQGQILDMEKSFEETKRLNEILIGEYSKNSGQTVEKLKADMARDNFMSAQEAIDYGLADEIIKPKIK